MLKTKLTTTFALLRKARACDSGYRKLAKYLGGVSTYGEHTPINIAVILKSNDLDDALWSLRATAEKADTFKRHLAASFAESVLHIYEKKHPLDERPRKAIQAARNFADGFITVEQLAVARRDAAYAAYAADACAAYAADAAADAAYAADAYAADAAADAAYAAYAADACAADAAAYLSAKARQDQKDKMAFIFLELLDTGN